MKLDYTTRTPEEIADEIAYRSYSYNRRRCPEDKPESYRCVFGGAVEAFERRYQRELGDLDQMQQRLASAYSTLHVSTREGLWKK
jgi:hypothetical protein